MEICHFFVIFHDFVMKCVYKSTIYTFVIRDKIWTPPLCCTKVYMLLLCFGSRKYPPHPIHVRHFCVSPPPPPPVASYYKLFFCLSHHAITSYSQSTIILPFILNPTMLLPNLFSPIML